MNPTQGSKWLAWGLVVLGALAAGAGSLWNLYDQFFWYDEVVHGYNFFALTLLVALYAYGTVLTGAEEHRILLVLTIVGMGLALGALWEVVEWGYDHFIAKPNVILPKTDTIIDLMVDTAGALAAGLLHLRMLRK